MKKYLILSLVFVILGLSFGVYYREATKIMTYTGYTTLAVIHPHLIILGGAFNLFMFFFTRKENFPSKVKSNIFFYAYNIGLALMATMMCVRGSLQVFNVDIKSSISSMISGIAGLTHITLAFGIIMFFVNLFDLVKQQ